jgi:hypothetical protein
MAMWKILTNLGKCFHKRLVVKLSADENGILIANSSFTGPFVIPWGEIDEILTFKIDLGTIDDIRLAIHYSAGWYELSEEDEGFKEVCEQIERRFPSIPETWFLDVMLPAFAPNHRVLWKRGVCD